MCNFEFDPSQWPRFSGSDRKIPCPYDSVTGYNFCMFHLLPRQRRRAFPTPQGRAREYLRILVNQRRAIIFCTTIDSLALSTAVKALASEIDIEIFLTYIRGKIDLSEVEISNKISISDSFIQEIDLSESTLD